MKKKNLTLIAVIAVIVIAAVALALVIGGNNSNKNTTTTTTTTTQKVEEPTPAISHREFVEFVVRLASDGNNHNNVVDENSLNAFNSILAADKMLNGSYNASEMYNQLIELGFDANEISELQIELIYGLENFDKIENNKASFVEIFKYMCEISGTEEGKQFIGEENSAALAILAADIMLALDIVDKEFTKDEMVECVKQLIDTYMDESAISMIPPEFKGIFDSDMSAVVINGMVSDIFKKYNNQYNDGKNGKDVKIPVFNFIVYLINEYPTISSMMDEYGVKEGANTAVSLFEQAREEYAYDEFLPFMDKLLAEASVFMEIDYNFDYTDETVKYIYIMYLYDNGAFDEIKMSGKDFIALVNNNVEENSTVGAMLDEGFVSKLGEASKIDEFLSDDNMYNYEAMTTNLNNLFNATENLIGSAPLSSDWLKKAYIEHSHGH